MKVGYVRISTKEQNTARQDVLMEKLGVERVFTDKLSGKDTQRPELQKMMDFVREGDVVVVESFSRFARNTRDLLDLTAALEEKGVRFRTKSDDAGEIYPYGFAATSGELDGAVDALSGVFQDMLKLAEIEKTSQLLAEEIEKTRRRVNALEYVKIPQMEEAIKYISMKLDENERSNTIRLMKVKDMLLKEAIEERSEEDARAARVFGSSGEAPQEV